MGYTCAICREPLTFLDEVDVDHIVPIRVRPDLWNEPKNCRCLHKACHSRRTGQYEADQARGFSVETDENGNPHDPNHPWNEVREYGELPPKRPSK